MRPMPSIIFASVTLALLGCSDSTGPSENGGPSFESPRPRPPETASLQVSPSEATIRTGETFQFTTTYSGDPALMGGPGGVIWYSSDETVATVLPGGLVRGISGGQVRIVAVWTGYQASALLTVVGTWKKDDSPIVCMRRQPTSGDHFGDHC